MKASKNNAKTDDQLLRGAKEGDRAAFSELVKRYEDMVYKFSFKVCRNKDEAEEALQDTFVNVYKNLSSFDGRSKLSTWLYRIVINNCLMKKRRRKLDDLMESYDEPPAGENSKHNARIPRWDETPADLLLNKEFHELLEEAILKLPVDYRIVFVLRDIEGRSTEEAAKILGISHEAAKSRLRRARAFLRDQLAPYMNVQEEAVE
ncbi:MAG: sigma-70 family RNA polymerase sigma factor [Ignavibacteriae bacterium]|nr:sigma-70 family RNA polymerase sigma factor [Ignavibacteriota bacterium]